MKFRSKAIISAVVSASLMLAGAVGGTIAFFTTSSETNVNVTSGKIAVSTVVSDLKTFSLDHEQPAGTFENGGTAALNAETQVITLDRMTPGDKATFKIAVSIENNVKVKYRVVFDKTGDLAPALVANVSGGASEWTMINPTENPTVVNLDGSVELPLSTSINYADKAGSVRILVEAVQGNMPQAVSSAAELEDAIAHIAEGGEVSLYVEEDITLTKIMTVPSNAKINLYGDGDTTISNAEGASRVINFDGVENTTLTLSGVELHQDTYNGSGYARTISAYGTTDCTINVYDSKLTNDSHYPINVASENVRLTINVEDSTLEGYCAVNVWSPGTTINVKNSTLRGINTHNGQDNCFSVIVFNGGSQYSVVNLDNCVVEAIQNGTSFESFISIREDNITINSTNTVFKQKRQGAAQFDVYNSIEEVFDYNSWLWVLTKTGDEISSFDDYDFYEGAYPQGVEARKYELVDIISIDNVFTAEEMTDTSSYIFGEVAVLRQAALEANAYATSVGSINGKQFLTPCRLTIA